MNLLTINKVNNEVIEIEYWDERLPYGNLDSPEDDVYHIISNQDYNIGDIYEP
jgi:hypothetical protein